MAFHKILVAIDSSNLCQSVFAQALDLAEANSSALMLIHCLSSETVAYPDSSMSSEMGAYSELDANSYQTQQIILKNHIEQAQALLQSYCQTAKTRGLLAEFDCKIGEAGQWLCETAQRWGADLIIMGRRGRTGLAEALLGSSSNYVLHHAPCSVLVIQQVNTQESSSQATGVVGEKLDKS